MVKTMYGIFLASAIFFFAVNAMAQDLPKGRWWKNSSVVKELSLNENEQEQIETVFMKYRSSVRHLKDEMWVEKRKIKRFMANPKKNERIIRERTGELEKARSALDKVKPSYVNNVRNILGPARFEKLVNLKP